jgi:hypothetical protein
MRTLSTLQLALLFACVGSLLAVFVPHFLRNLHASRFAEPIEGLNHLATWASVQAAGLPTEIAYPSSVGRTPEQVPAGDAHGDSEGTWAHPTWKLLGFKKTSPHFYSFEFESACTASGAHFTARAFGDLDGDGELSRFELYGETRPHDQPTVYSIRMHREVE